MENTALFTKSISLEKYGIKNAQEIIYNPSFDFLYQEELNPSLEGYERGQLTELGAVNVMTGEFTGRSPKDKYIVKDAVTENSIWWNSEKAVKISERPSDCCPKMWPELSWGGRGVRRLCKMISDWRTNRS